MLAIEENAVFIEVGIRGILKALIMTESISKLDDPMIGTGRMVQGDLDSLHFQSTVDRLDM